MEDADLGTQVDRSLKRHDRDLSRYDESDCAGGGPGSKRRENGNGVCHHR